MTKTFVIPASLRRRFSYLFLIIFFGVQTWAAASYYMGDYVWDERFSWRMFSTVRNLKCDFKMWRRSPQGKDQCPDDSPTRCDRVRLNKEQHMVWVNLMKRGRLSVLDHWAVHECKSQDQFGGVFVKLQCQSPDPLGKWTLVQSPRVNLCRAPQQRQPSVSIN